MRYLVLASCLLISLFVSHSVFAIQFTPLPIDNLDTADVNLTSYESDVGGGFSGIFDATSLGASGTSDHFDDAFGVSVNGSPYGATAGIAGDNELTLEQLSFGQFDVSVGLRSIGPVVRQIVNVTNNGATGGDVAIQWHNNTGNDAGQQTIATSDGNLTADVSDRWIVTADSSNILADNTEVNAWVLFGLGGTEPSFVDLVDGSAVFGGFGEQGLTAIFDLQLEPGETESLLWFVGIEGIGQDGIDVANLLDDQSSVLFQESIADLTSIERSQVANFATVVPEPGSASFLGSLGMMLIMSRRRTSGIPA